MDMLKGFAIFMVIVGHAVQYLVSGDYWDKGVYRVIYSFHMPLFMAISGFFAKAVIDSGKYSVNQLIAKRCWSLMMPIVVFAFIMRYVFGEYGRLINPIMYSLWFLKSALFCFVLYAVTVSLPTKRKWFPLLLSLVVSQAFILYNIKMMYPCFLAGAFLKDKLATVQQRRKEITLVSGIVWLLLVLFFDASFWRYQPQDSLIFLTPELAMSFDWWYVMGYRLAIGLSGSLMFFGIFEWLASRNFHNTYFGKGLNQAGRETLWIYVLQTILLETYLARWFNFDTIPQGLFYVVIVPLISILVLLGCMGILKMTTLVYVFLKKHHIILSSRNIE